MPLRVKLEEANGSYFEALRLTREHTDREGEGIALGNIGFIYRTQSRVDEALKYLQQALFIFNKIGASPQAMLVQKAIDKIRQNP